MGFEEQAGVAIQKVPPEGGGGEITGLGCV
jgi:hypothetical protein